jgi:hypothetical protein
MPRSALCARAVAGYHFRTGAPQACFEKPFEALEQKQLASFYQSVERGNFVVRVASLSNQDRSTGIDPTGGPHPCVQHFWP